VATNRPRQTRAGRLRKSWLHTLVVADAISRTLLKVTRSKSPREHGIHHDCKWRPAGINLPAETQFIRQRERERVPLHDQRAPS
jgi:hypothetical protein